MVEKALEGLGGVAIVNNSEWAIGMLSSIRTGISALPSCAQGCLIHHGDVPFIDASTIQTMIAGIHAELEQSSSSSAAPLVASCAGIHGHPAFLPARLFKDVLALDSKETIWGLLERNGCKYIETESYAVLDDVDTLADYRSLVSKYKYQYQYELDIEAMD
jgi:CTP:molybdopterin cytidylyltransferase MocA